MVDVMKTPQSDKPNGFLPRKKARRYAMQAIYAWIVAETAPEDLAQDMIQAHASESWDQAYFSALLLGVVEQQDSIQSHLIPHLIDRPFNSLDPVESSVLQMAAYELLFRWDVPYRVVINEAVDLAKQFGATDGHKFVNGVLDKLSVSIPDRINT